MTKQYSPEIGFQTVVNRKSGIFLDTEDLLDLSEGNSAHVGRPPDGDDTPCDPPGPGKGPQEPPGRGGGDPTPGGGHGPGDGP